MNLKDYLNRFNSKFKDSYGWDKLSMWLLIAGIILIFSRWTIILGFASIVYSTWRSLSKDRYRRQLELSVFQNSMNMIVSRINKHKYRLEEYRKYKIFKCPGCSQKLRVPRHKGQVTITCRKCGTEFKGKS